MHEPQHLIPAPFLEEISVNEVANSVDLLCFSELSPSCNNDVLVSVDHSSLSNELNSGLKDNEQHGDSVLMHQNSCNVNNRFIKVYPLITPENVLEQLFIHPLKVLIPIISKKLPARFLFPLLNLKVLKLLIRIPLIILKTSLCR